MAAFLRHGEPGSYKSVLLVQLFIVPALKEGRTVVTNIEGLKSKEEIERLLGEAFPKKAQLWRITSLRDGGKYIWQRWFHWAPLKALIVIDEVQDIYPADRRIRLEDYDNQGIEQIAHRLPKHYVETYHTLRDSYQAPDDESTDDLGQTTYDEDGKIIYPATLLGAMTRHRKFTWDICFATPDITLVNMAIRGSCEYAYKHNSMDLIGKVIPYFRARPRVKQHRPKSNGESLTKGQHMEFKKVDERYFQLYKSTQTGEHVESGRGKSFLDTTWFKILAFGFPCFIAFGIYSLLPDDSPQNTALQASEGGQGYTTQSTSVGGRVDSASQNLVFGHGASINRYIPGHPTTIDLVATVRVTQNGEFIRFEMLYRMGRGDKVWYMDDKALYQYGVKSHYISECLVNIVKGDVQKVVMCKLDKKIIKGEFSQM